MIKPVNLKEVEQTSDHFTEMLKAIQNNKYQDSHLQGLRDCRWLFETWIAQLHKENKELNKNTEGTISSLRADIKHLMNRREELEAELKTLTHGIPIERAKEGRKPVLAKFKDDMSHVNNCNQFAGLWAVVRHNGYEDDPDGWGYAGPVGMGGFPDDSFEIFLFLPSQTQEGDKE